MTMNTHTPGPWNVSRHATPDYAPQFGIYDDSAIGSLATIVGDNAAADAALVGAAPDLLAALEAIEAYEDSDPSPGTREAEIAAMRRAAIAKAKGGAA